MEFTPLCGTSSRSDREYASAVADYLELHGFKVWYDYQLNVGEHFDQEIQRQISTSAALVVILTPASVTSKWVMREIACADDHSIPMVPLRRSPCLTPLRLQSVQAEEVSAGNMPSERFIARLRALAGRSSTTAEQNGRDEAPEAEPPVVIIDPETAVELSPKMTGAGSAFGLVRSLAGPAGRVRSVVFSSDGSTLISGGEDRTIHAWDTSSWSPGPKFRSDHEASWPLACVPGTSSFGVRAHGRGGVEIR